MRIAACQILLLIAVVSSGRAQQPGMQNDWDIRKTLGAVASLCDSLAPFVGQIHPESWIAAGAGEGYIAQAKTCRDELKAVAADARGLGQNPQKLPAELQLLFRIRGLESRLASLGEGLRKYQNPPMADLLSDAVAQNGGNLQRLQQYILELAGEREQEFHVADEEAQRCRQSLSRQPSRDRAAPPSQEKN